SWRRKLGSETANASELQKERQNTQHPTSNTQHPINASRGKPSSSTSVVGSCGMSLHAKRPIGCWVLDVGRWMFCLHASGLPFLSLPLNIRPCDSCCSSRCSFFARLLVRS